MEASPAPTLTRRGCWGASATPGLDGAAEGGSAASALPWGVEGRAATRALPLGLWLRRLGRRDVFRRRRRVSERNTFARGMRGPLGYNCSHPAKRGVAPGSTMEIAPRGSTRVSWRRA